MKPTAESVSAGIDLSGKTAIVTGASSGLGREAARVLALRGATTVFAVRNLEKGSAVVRELVLPEAARARCHVRHCELSSMASVRAFADEVAREERVVDLVLLNAGIFGQPYRLTEEGFERTYATNYLGHFLLLHELLTRQQLAADARVLATLSENVRLNPFLSADLALVVDAAGARKRFGRNASPNAKVLLTLALQRFTRVAPAAGYAGVSFDGCDPGATLTDNVNQMGPVANAISRLLAPLLFKPVEQGAAVMLWALTDPALRARSGRCFVASLKEAPIPRRWTDEAQAEAAWRTTEERLGLTPWPARAASGPLPA